MAYRLPYEGLLLVSDIDGTLVTSNHDLPMRNIDAVQAFVAGGGYFAVATGRTPPSAGVFLDRLHVNAPCILCNGTVLFDFNTQETLWSAELPKNLCDLVAKVIRNISDVGVEIITDKIVYVAHTNDVTRRHTVNKALHYVHMDIENVPKHGWHKVIFTARPKQIPVVFDFVNRQPNHGWDFVHSEPEFLEALPQNISKGTTILHLANLLHVDKHNIFAIGDYYNDLSLLKTAAFSAAPKNSPDEIKNMVNVVVGSCEQGAVADFIDCIKLRMSNETYLQENTMSLM